MSRFIILLLALPLAGTLFGQGLAQNQDHLKYIERFKDLAMEEMIRAGIPASIKLAQGLHESGAGSSYLATRANNHFGIKCGSKWTGREAYREDDDFDDRGQLIKSCFRSYRNPDASFRDHSEFLRDPAKMRYNFLFRLDPMDYMAWANGLRRAGYATDPAYPQKLIRIIETYGLDRFDRLAVNESIFDDPVLGGDNSSQGELPTYPDDPFTAPETPISSIGQYNDVTYFLSGEAITVDELARRVDLSVRRILSYNERLNEGSQQLEVGDRVYLQPKRNSYRGRDRYHVVQEGETIFDISQRYAIKVDRLLRRNRLSPGQEPAAGERIKLRGGRVSRDKVPKLQGAVQPDSGSDPFTPSTPSTPNVPVTEDGQIDMDDPTPPFDTEVENPGTISPPTDGGVVSPPVVSPPPPTPPVFDPTSPPTTNDPDSSPGTDNPIDPSTPTFDPPGNPSTSVPLPTSRFHTVIRGETLYAISRRYDTTVDAIKQLNGLNSNNIFIGQRLRVE